MIENFGNNVARLRKQRGMTQIELAKEIGVNKQTISNIEKGESYPTFNNLEKISTVLNASAIQLFGTPEEINLFDAQEALEEIQQNSGLIYQTLEARNFIDEIMNDTHFQRILADLSTVYHMFTPHPVLDEDGVPEINFKTKQVKMTPSLFSRIPFEDISKAAAELEFILDNRDKIPKHQ